MFLTNNFENTEPVLSEDALELDQLINEAILLDEGFDLDEAAVLDLIDESVLNERTIVRMDKIAKKTRAIKLAAYALARKAKDRLWKKLVTVHKLRKKLIAAIMKKYAMKAKANVQKNKSALSRNSKVASLAGKGKSSRHLLKNKKTPTIK